MIKVIVSQFWQDFKKNWVRFIIYTATAYFLMTNLSYERFSTVMQDSNAALFTVLGISFLTSILWLKGLINWIPIRLSKPFYACAAGPKEKYKYLKFDFLIRFISSWILMCPFLVFGFGGFIVWSQPVSALIQISLLFFTIWDINLIIAAPNGLQNNLCHSRFRNKYEEYVRFEWFALLLLENVTFYTIMALGKGTALWNIPIWAVIFLINVVIARRITPHVLSIALSFEAVYGSPKNN